MYGPNNRLLSMKPTRRYWEEYGNPGGTPVVFVHGGPGGGIDGRSHRFFDPTAYKIILLCQRGCGRSTPLGCLTDNTTWDLVADLEALRENRRIESWVVFGGSWGSTLSLTYAQTHPERVLALVLRGIFAIRHAEIAWFYERGGAEMLLPEAFDEYIAGLPENMRGNTSLLDAFHKVLNGDNVEEARRAALAWSSWEGAASYVAPPSGKQKYGDPDFAAVFARIECHYFSNKGFFERDGYLLEPAQMKRSNISRL